MEDFRSNLNRYIIRAFMEERPLVIVESADDRQIYTNIANSLGLNLAIHRVSDFELPAGCNGIIGCIEFIQPNAQTDERYEKLILGVIDRDARFYKNKEEFMGLQGLKCLFILKYYSIETYFATRSNLQKLITKITNAIHTDITDEMLHEIETNINHSLETLYYLSLDALKQECLGKENHVAFKNLGTEEKEINIVGENVMKAFKETKLPLIKDLLDEFAVNNDISVTDIKLITKGKWYLFNFIYRSYEPIKQLKEKEELNKINTPNYKDSKLIFDIKLDLPPVPMYAYLYSTILECLDHTELADIIQKLRELGLKDVNNAS